MADTNLTDVFVHHLHELRRVLALMTPDERLLAVILECGELIELYQEIARLNDLFHHHCEAGTLPLADTVGHA
jgi:hypothetical protein